MSFKIAFIGAGSVGFTRKLLSDLLTVPEFHDIEVAFTDINQQNLDMVTQLCQRDIYENGLNIKIHATLDGREVFKEAKYVINCAGVYADEISAMAGDKCYTIHPRKGTLAILDKNAPPEFDPLTRLYTGHEVQNKKNSINALAQIVADMHQLYSVAQNIEQYCEEYAAFSGNGVMPVIKHRAMVLCLEYIVHKLLVLNVREQLFIMSIA